MCCIFYMYIFYCSHFISLHFWSIWLFDDFKCCKYQNIIHLFSLILNNQCGLCWSWKEQCCPWIQLFLKLLSVILLNCRSRLGMQREAWCWVSGLSGLPPCAVSLWPSVVVVGLSNLAFLAVPCLHSGSNSSAECLLLKVLRAFSLVDYGQILWKGFGFWWLSWFWGRWESHA